MVGILDTITVCTRVFVLHMRNASCIKNKKQNNNVTLYFHMVVRYKNTKMNTESFNT